MTTKHSTRNKAKNRTKRSPHLFLPPRDASSQDKAGEASGASGSKNLSGFTLVELMVAMCVSLMLLGGVVSLFGTLGESVNDSKSNSEMLQTVRRASDKLRIDLGNLSLVPDPAQAMHNSQGFFEYIEGGGSDKNLLPPPEQTLPDPIILDDGGSSFTAVSDGSQNIFKPFGNTGAKRRSYGMTVHEKNSKFLKNEGLFKATGLGAGKYRVSLTWPIKWNGENGNWASKTETSVPVKLFSGDDLVEDTTVDQSQAPSDFEDPEGNTNDYVEPIRWENIGGEIDVTANGEITVQIGPCGIANGYTAPNMRVFADAIRIECLELSPESNDTNAPPPQMSIKGDCDDVLHFTTTSDDGAQEVVWFCTPMPGDENKTEDDQTKNYRLHRYARPVNPTIEDLTSEDASFGADGTPNSLKDLALRRNRFAHYPSETDEYKLNPRSAYEEQLKEEVKNPDGTIKYAEDERPRKTVILENVIGFDVKAYDSQLPVYKNSQDIVVGPGDHGYLAAIEDGGSIKVGEGAFRDLGNHQGNFEELGINTDFKVESASLMIQADPTGSTYDSWSGDYVKTGDVGFDDWNAETGAQTPDGIIETAEDLRQSPPYKTPLQGIQVEIRVQEPESGKVRTVKIRKFLGKR